MGSLLSALKKTDGSGGVSLQLEGDVEPSSPQEAEIHQRVQAVLQDATQHMECLRAYDNAREALIREAIASPSQETQMAAWQAVLPAVNQLLTFYEYGNALGGVFPDLLVALCCEDPKAGVQTQQCLVRDLAQIFDFVLDFDDTKAKRPHIQNDFSYYRRSLNQMKARADNVIVRDELANRMSMFFAFPSPMMKAMSDSVVGFLSEAGAPTTTDAVASALAVVANACQELVQSKSVASDATNLFCLRTMTGAIILYDNVHHEGAFKKKSPIKIKQCILTLRESSHDTSVLMNALRYTPPHLNDPDVPSNLKALLMED